MAQKRQRRPGKGAPDKKRGVSNIGRNKDTTRQRPGQGLGVHSAAASAIPSRRDPKASQQRPQARQSASRAPEAANTSPWAHLGAAEPHRRAGGGEKRWRFPVPPDTPDDLQFDWLFPPAVMRKQDVLMLAAEALGPERDGPRGAFAAQVIVATADLTRRLVERPEYVCCVACERTFGRGEGAGAFLVGIVGVETRTWPLCAECAAQDDLDTIRQADAALAGAYRGEA
jgi:hypothetical protein